MEEELLPPPPKKQSSPAPVSEGEGELLPPPPKKKAVNAPTSGSVGTTTPASSQPAKPSQESGAKGETVVTNYTTADVFDLAQKRNTASEGAYKSYSTVETNNRYPQIKTLSELYKQLEQAKMGLGLAGDSPERIQSLIDAERSKPVEAVVYGVDTNGNPKELQKPAQKTVGEMYDATIKAQQDFTKYQQEAQELSKQLDPIVKQEREREKFVPTVKDEDGNEYYELNPWESFKQGFEGSLDGIVIGALNLFGDKEKTAEAMKKKWVNDNLLYPKQADDIPAQATEMLGGVTPLVVGAAVAPEGVGTLITNALLFGAQDYGGTLYRSFAEGKAEGLSDNEALEKAETNARFAGVKGAVLGATLPAQGALGRRIFINEAERGAFKTFLAEQSVMAPAFGGSTAIQNLYEGKPIAEGVPQTIGDAFIIGGMMHAISAGAKLPAQIKTTFEKTIAKNFEPIAGVFEKGVSEGAIDFGTAQRIQTYAKAYEAMPKEMPAKIEDAVVEDVIQVQRLEAEKEATTEAFHPAIEAQIEAKNREIAEKTGAPLNTKEQKEYEKLIEKRDKTDGEGNKTPLTESEKRAIAHYEKRMETAKNIDQQNTKKLKEGKQNEVGDTLELTPKVTEAKMDEQPVVETKANETIVPVEEQTIAQETPTETAVEETVTEAVPTTQEIADTPQGGYETITEEIQMPDGEQGFKVSIKKPDGEVVEVGSMYPEDVQSEVAKKVRGFELQKSKPAKEETITEQTAPKEDFTGKEVSFDFAGSDRKGTVQGIDEQGNYKIKGADGTNYTVKPEKAITVESKTAAEKSLSDNLKKIQELTKPKSKVKPSKEPPAVKMGLGEEVIKAPFKLLGMGDKYAEALTKKIEDGVAKSYRRGTEVSNKYAARTVSEAQGLFRQLGLTQEEITKRRQSLGAIKAAPLKALNFYKNGIDIVGKTPESLQNVHMVLDPEVYSARSITPKSEADLSPSEKQLYDILRSTNNMIHDWHFLNGRITEETYLKNKDKYAPRFYENIEFEGLPEDIKASFEDYAKQQNFSYIKERQQFEDVMAENRVIEDPVYGTAMRLAQMMRNQAVMEYAADLNSRIKTYEEGDANIPSTYVKLEGGGQFGNINTYGQLTNKYVPRDIAEDFKSYTFINAATNLAYDFVKQYDRLWIRQALKKTKTLYNPITQLGNIGSNYVFAMMNGIDPITFQRRKFEAAESVKNKDELYMKLVEEGILGTDITTKDLKVEAGPKAEPKKGLRQLASLIDDKISDFYGSRDEIAKVAAYLSHTKDYGRSESDALNRVAEGFQNYENVGRFYDFAAKTPVVGNPFIKFKGDLLRIMKNNFANRPLTNIALLAALNATASAFSKWSDEDEAIKEVRERRAFIPKVPLPDALGGDIPLTWQTPIGEINAARYFSPLNVYDMGDKGSLAEEISQFSPFQVKGGDGDLPLPAINDPFLGTYAQLWFDRDFRGKPILDPEETKWREGNATTQEKIQNAGTFIARQQIPFYQNVDDFLRAVNEEPDYYGRNRDLKQALLQNFIKIQEFNKPEAIESLTKEIDYRMGQLDKLNRDISSARSLTRKNIKKITEREISESSRQRLISEEQDRLDKKVAEILNKQADIKAKLLEPERLLEEIGESQAGKKGSQKSSFKSPSGFRGFNKQ